MVALGPTKGTGSNSLPVVSCHHASTAIKSCYVWCKRWHALLKSIVSCFSAFSMTDKEPPIITASTSTPTRLPFIILPVTICIVVRLRVWITWPWWLTIFVVQKESKTWVSLVHRFQHRSIVKSPPKFKKKKRIIISNYLSSTMFYKYTCMFDKFNANTHNAKKLFANVRNCCLQCHS